MSSKSKLSIPQNLQDKAITAESLIRLSLEAVRQQERDQAAHIARVFGADEKLIAALQRGRV